MIDKLIVLLQQLNKVYTKLYELSQKKQQSIIGNDADAVNEIVKEEWTLVSEAGDLEEARKELLSLHFGKGDDKPVTLDDVIAKAKPAEREALEAEAEQLKDTIEKLKRVNNENQSLIDLHLEYMDYMVNVVLKEPQISNIYGNSGVVEEPNTGGRRLIDNEA